MNRRMVLYMLGSVVKIEALLLLLPLVTSLIYGESTSVTAFLISIAVALAIGFGMTLLAHPGSKVIYAKEGFVTVALSWVFLSLIGCLPFVISGEIPNFIDAFFETVSGFTTTGASILTDVEAMGKGMLFWRSFTHWVGGMGVLVFVMAIIPSFSERSIHLLRAEVPGPVVGKLVPKIKQTARILYIIYVVITLVEVILLLLGGMPVFDSLVHAFGTAGTGGFGIKADSIGSYNSYLQWVITIFMLIFGVNFNLYYFILIKKAKLAFKSTELWFYLGIVAFSIICITANIFPLYDSISETIKHAAFQVAGFITTTGYATADFNSWPIFSKTLLFLLMFLGGCAGSTAGGFKLSRVMMLIKNAKRELQRMLHPRSVAVVKFEGKRVDDITINSVTAYLSIYILFFCIIVFIIGFEKFDIETNITAVASCFNNIGPAFGQAAANYSEYSPFGKIILSVAMLLGRLEIYPIILTLSPSTWRKK
ncbi:MAG: TrkH family potassium uptake protein [Clostridia bacterium]|nr:TrkH family potassium uptake protein [Clostridia bacterium]MBQ1994768.1 TrkH family potassium uptake protein [Clostridia bacterium]